MSNPPDPHNRSSDSPNPEQPQQNLPPQTPQPPGYGYPPPPGYNAPPPGYGPPIQGPPGTGPTPGGPGYGAPASGGPSAPGNPVYGTPPNYGGPSAPGNPVPGTSPSYGDPAAPGNPGYGTPPGYGGPSSPGIPAYGSQPGYGTPQPGAYGYGGPPPGYQQGAPGYGYPPAGYGPRPPYASWIQRVGGALVDGLIVGVPAAILYILGLTVGFSAQTCTPDENGYPDCTGGGLSAAGWILFIVAWLFAVAGGLYLIYLVGTTGQTPGKRMVGIRLVREADGQVLGFGMAFVRNLCHVLDGFCYIGYLWPIWDEKRQTFADKIMKSIVVQV